MSLDIWPFFGDKHERHLFRVSLFALGMMMLGFVLIQWSIQYPLAHPLWTLFPLCVLITGCVIWLVTPLYAIVLCELTCADMYKQEVEPPSYTPQAAAAAA